LVDDDESDNFIHEIIIKEAGVCDQIRVATDGRKALDYLIKTENPDLAEEYPKPNIIFLDINMPRMNGFEFLEEYTNLEDHLKSHVVITMLTTSLNPNDEQRARAVHEVHEFMNKPLTVEKLNGIVEKYF
jgi:CheY-like chemotaxis protein